MEEFQPTQQPTRSWQQEEERRSPTQGVYNGEERRKADQQLEDMAKGQQGG